MMRARKYLSFAVNPVREVQHWTSGIFRELQSDVDVQAKVRTEIEYPDACVFVYSDAPPTDDDLSAIQEACVS